jgi:heme exporter protein A
MVEITDLTVYRNRIPVVNGVSLAVRSGELVAVAGANGAGKSTLLKCLAGVVRPDRGVVMWFETSSRLTRTARCQIGFAGHDCGLYAELTAFENLVFAARMHGVTHPAARAKEALTAAGLEGMAGRPVRHLSQGMRQRLAIARAVLHEPTLILLDEPFASLDEAGRCWVEQLFRQWRLAARAVCYVSHDAPRNHELADRIIVLDAGRIVESKTQHGARYRQRSA